MGHVLREKWSEDMIVHEIEKIVSDLQLDHFPTHREMDNYFGNRALTMKVSKSGGTRLWAKKMNLPIKTCESEFGNKFELIAIDDIKKNVGMTAFQTKPRYPYDLVVENNIKVDVKSSNVIVNRDGVRAFVFNIEKKYPTCDIFMFYCNGDDDLESKLLIIPSCILFGQSQIGVGRKSKWDTFCDNWDVFYQYRNFYHSILKAFPELTGRCVDG